MGAELRAPLDQEIKYVIIEGEYGIAHLILGFENDSLGAGGLENFAEGSVRVIDGLYGRIDSPVVRLRRPSNGYRKTCCDSLATSYPTNFSAIDPP